MLVYSNALQLLTLSADDSVHCNAAVQKEVLEENKYHCGACLQPGWPMLCPVPGTLLLVYASALKLPPVLPVTVACFHGL